MELIKTDFEGLYIIKNQILGDARGAFIKKYNAEVFEANGVFFDLKEQYYSLSQKGVVRGMHFQVPPYDHSKLIYVIRGSILDVALDIRKNSPTYGKCFSCVLSGSENTSLFLPKGFAHGFRSLEDDTLMMYNVSSGYHQECDCGISWDSIGFDWNIETPVLSERDKTFPALKDFHSPF